MTRNRMIVGPLIGVAPTHMAQFVAEWLSQPRGKPSAAAGAVRTPPRPGRASTTPTAAPKQQPATHLKVPPAEWRAPLDAWELRELKQGIQAEAYQADRSRSADRIRAVRLGGELGRKHGRDPWRAAAALRIPVYLDSKTAAMAHYTRRKDVIAFSPWFGRPEAFLSLAHELGHRELGHAGPRSAEEEITQETEARAFARAFFLE